MMKLFEDPNAFPEYTMEDLEKDKPELIDLVKRYYALEGAVELVSQELHDRYWKLYDDPLNIPDAISLNGQEAYEAMLEEVASATVERERISKELQEAIDSSDREVLDAYCRMLQGEERPVDVFSALCDSDALKDGLETMPHDVILQAQEELKGINESDVKEFMEAENAARKEEQRLSAILEKKRRKLEQQSIAQDLSYKMLLTKELANRMGLPPVTNQNFLKNMPLDDLQQLQERSRQVFELGRQYGGDIDWYDRGEVGMLLDELFEGKE